MNETCQRCQCPGPDLRYLRMSCFYDMSETGIPFEKVENEGTANTKPRTEYVLRVCKRCRADWLDAQTNWFTDKPSSEPELQEGEVLVRRNGVCVAGLPNE